MIDVEILIWRERTFAEFDLNRMKTKSFKAEQDVSLHESLDILVLVTGEFNLFKAKNSEYVVHQMFDLMA